jgi:UDPglucose 6-dehydrogenase
MKIAIWGSELTAWVTAAALAQTGNDICFVSNSQITDPITLMGSSIRNEPGLRDLVIDGFENKRIRLAQTRTALGIQAHVLSMNPSEFDRAYAIVEQLASKAEGPLLVINQSPGRRLFCGKYFRGRGARPDSPAEGTDPRQRRRGSHAHPASAVQAVQHPA